MPFTPAVSDAPFVYADLNQYRPDQVGNPSVPNPSANSWFNPAAFTSLRKASGETAMCVTTLSAAQIRELRPVVREDIHVEAEGKTLEFKWENYNAFNHVNLANPNNYVDVTGAGQISAAATMRQMQFGLHFRF